MKSKELGNRPHSADTLTHEHLESLWEKGLIGKDNAKSLQCGVYVYFTQCFGFRGSHESRQLCWDDVTMKSDRDGRYLEFNERLTKTRTAETSKCSTRKFMPKIFTNTVNAERCPASKRLSQHCAPERHYILL